MRPDKRFKQLVTDRLVLRRSLPEDAETISRYRSDPEVHRYQGWERTDPDGVREEIVDASTRAPGQPGGWVQFSLIEREGGTLVGDVGLSPADGEPDVIKTGYTVAPEHQGNGYATEAIRSLIAYAFDRLGAEVVRAYATAENVASHRVAEKAGMRLMERFEGRDDGHVWHGVRYEIHRGDASTTPDGLP